MARQERQPCDQSRSLPAGIIFSPDRRCFDKVSAMGWMDYFYFSLINITTLGLGDIYPTQHLRVIAGVEALTGFALISCSAQLFWSMTKKGDKQ